MKRIIVITALIALFVVFSVPSAFAQSSHRVRGHWRDTDRDGVKDTYVDSYTRTNPNSSRTDNFSYPGNYNPNRGEFTPHRDSSKELFPSNSSPFERKRSLGLDSILDD